MVKIALFTQNVVDHAYSAVLAGWAHALVRSGVTAIDVVSIVGDPSQALNQFPPEVRHVVLPGGRAARALMPLRRYLRDQKPDVLMSAVININLLAIVAAKTTKWPGKLIITHHHPIALSHADTWKDNKHAARLLYRFADASVAVSPEVMEDAIRVGRLDRSTVTCIPNVLPPPSGLAATEPPHRWLGGDRPGPVFVTVSRLVQSKNLPLLLAAFARVTVELDARLIIIGKGSREPETSALVSQMKLDDRVDMAGFVNSPRSYLQRADAFVLASNEEGFGQVLVEAMSVGLPVISTDATGGGPRFVLDGGRYGLLVPKGDAEALAAAMVAMANVSTRADYAALGRERARDFSPAAVGASLAEFIGKVCGTAEEMLQSDDRRPAGG
jgi:glycosyltransferase involved in cell wall biosynthesis